MEQKHALMSKTMWFNVMMSVIAVFGAKWPAVQEYMSAENVALFFSFFNVVLRAVSKDKVYFWG